MFWGGKKGEKKEISHSTKGILRKLPEQTNSPILNLEEEAENLFSERPPETWKRVLTSYFYRA
jgi:hypothetical protein